MVHHFEQREYFRDSVGRKQTHGIPNFTTAASNAVDLRGECSGKKNQLGEAKCYMSFPEPNNFLIIRTDNY